MVLAYLIVELGYEMGIAHMNFQLRGNDSLEDERFVKDFAMEKEVPFHSKRVETEVIAKDLGLSIQMAARELRYSWFEELMTNNRYDYLLTAHHASDHLETALFNFTKGSGVQGLKGIEPKSQKCIRPLLAYTRREIESYALSVGLKWREDQSNQDPKYSRNLLRNEVIPLLKNINPSIERTFQDSSIRMKAASILLHEKVRSIENRFLKTDRRKSRLSLGWLSNPDIDLTILHEILRKFNFSFAEVKQIFNQINSQSGKIFKNDTFLANLDRGELIIVNNQESESQIHEIHDGMTKIDTSGGSIEIESLSGQVPIDKDNDHAFMDKSKLKFPLILRKWQRGDFFHPIGMDHRKKISDFLVDQKVPLVEKEDVYVVESKNKICWVVGMRIDERFKVEKETEEIYHLRKYDENQ